MNIADLFSELIKSYEQYQRMAKQTREDVESIPYIGKHMLNISNFLGGPEVQEALDAAQMNLPMMALTKPAFAKVVSGLLKSTEPTEQLGRVAKKVVKGIDEVIPYTKKTVRPDIYSPNIRGSIQTKGITTSFDSPAKAEKTIMALKKGVKIRTPLHEAGHELYYMLPKESKNLVDKACQNMSRETINKLESNLDVLVFNPEELFAEAYSLYLAGNKDFKLMPPFIQYIIKKSHKLAR